MEKAKIISCDWQYSGELLPRAVAKFGTIAELAKAIGMNRMSVSNWVHGKYTPTAASIIKLSEALERGALLRFVGLQSEQRKAVQATNKTKGRENANDN